MGTRPGVEEHGCDLADAQFVLAEHELAEAGGRAPVDAAQVVAHLVGTEGEELLAQLAQVRRPVRPGVGVEAHGVGQGLDGVDAGVDGELGRGGGLQRRAGQPEGIG